MDESLRNKNRRDELNPFSQGLISKEASMKATLSILVSWVITFCFFRNVRKAIGWLRSVYKIQNVLRSEERKRILKNLQSNLNYKILWFQRAIKIPQFVGLHHLNLGLTDWIEGRPGDERYLSNWGQIWNSKFLCIITIEVYCYQVAMIGYGWHALRSVQRNRTNLLIDHTNHVVSFKFKIWADRGPKN